jgi:UDP-2,3-diacylglucosamine hydrolase
MESFLSLLDREREGMGHLVILGDLFEFLFGFKPETPKPTSPFDDGSFPYPDYLPVFKQLFSLYQQGVQIKYFEGNHDFSLKSFFAEHLGMNVEVYAEGQEERLGSKRAFIAHGDLSNPHQWKYRMFRRCLKNRVTEKILRGVGPAFTRRMAQRLNELSHRHYHQNKPAKPSSAFQSFAHRKFLEGFDLVILGHSHIPETAEERIHGKNCLYYNVGDWMNHRSYLRFIPPDRFTLERYEKPSNPPNPPFLKGGQGGIIDCMRDPEKEKDGEIGRSGDGETTNRKGKSKMG